MDKDSKTILFPYGESVDSRLKGYKGSITHPVLPLERTFCYNCGKPKGWVSREQGEYIRVLGIIVICDECDAKLGKLQLEEAPIVETKLGD